MGKKYIYYSVDHKQFIMIRKMWNDGNKGWQ